MALELSDFGSYYIGGSLRHITEGTPTTVNFTRDVAFTRDPRGNYAYGQAYIQYFCPQQRNTFPPVVLLHGGGMCGTTWETTPDGRPGWLHMLLRRGFEVHVIDSVERGRAGFSPDAFDGDPIERSLEEAWHLFRFGSVENFSTKVPYESQQFPTGFIDYFARYFVPRWLTTTHLQVNALVQILQKLKSSILITHSQGGEIGFDAAEQVPENLAAIIAIEPSGTPKSIEHLRQIPTVLLQGDYLDSDDRWTKRAATWQALVRNLKVRAEVATLVDLPTAVGAGNSHLPMMDLNNEKCLEVALDKLYESIN